LAAYFVAPLLPRFAGRFLVPLVLAAAGIYLGFIDRSGRNLRHFRSLQHAAGLIAVLAALWSVLPSSAQSTLRWTAYSDAALQAAQANAQPLLLDFIADWCIPCHEMEETTFADAEVQEALARFATVRADITAESEATTALTDKYAVKGVPTLILFGTGGQELHRLVGYVGADELLAALQRVP
jgi:thiol:disulfide interchange protein DsbD